MIIPDWLFQEPIENKVKKTYNPKSIKQISRDNIKLDDKQLNKNLAKKMPYFIISLTEISKWDSKLP